MPRWQIPLSLQGSGVLSRAHFFHASPRKTRLWPAPCGRKFNPGFAQPAKRGMYRCQACRERIRQGRA